MPSEFDQLKSDISDVNENVNDLKINVAVIKNEVSDMKYTITNAVDRISTSMETLAIVSEKLNYNLEEHKTINKKIAALEDSQYEQREFLHEVRNYHVSCLEKRKIKEDSEKNSPINRAKDKAVEYIFIGLTALLVYIVFVHFRDFLIFMNTTGDANPLLK